MSDRIGYYYLRGRYVVQCNVEPGMNIGLISLNDHHGQVAGEAEVNTKPKITLEAGYSCHSDIRYSLFNT